MGIEKGTLSGTENGTLRDGPSGGERSDRSGGRRISPSPFAPSVQVHCALAPEPQVTLRCASDSVGPVDRRGQSSTPDPQPGRQSLGVENAREAFRTEP